jgi:S1-C subfamily serine protease
VNVESNSPASQAGVLLGDVIVYSARDRIGKSVKMRVIRGGVLTELAIAVGERTIKSENCKCLPTD